MEEDHTSTQSESPCHVLSQVVFSWALAGPLGDFDFDTEDITKPFTDHSAARTDYMDPVFHRPRLAKTHLPTDLVSAVPAENDDIQAQAVLVPSLLHTMAASHAVPAPDLASTAIYLAESAGFFGLDESTNTSQVNSAMDEKVAGMRAQKHEHGAYTFHIPGDAIPLPQTRLGHDGLRVSSHDMFESVPINLGEWRLGADDNHDDVSDGLRMDDSHGVQPRGKAKMMVDTTIGVLEAGGSINPAVRAPANINNTSKTDGYRADMHMTPTVQGGCDQLLRVPGIQQESTTTTTTQEGPPSVEGRATWGKGDGMMQQEGADVGSMENGKLKPTKTDLFRIPKRLKDDYKLYLKATSEDFERGTLDELGCKLCPGANFKTWDHFKRHCKTSKRHPLRMVVCDRCGRHFTRPDSLKRHFENRVCKNFPETNHGV